MKVVRNSHINPSHLAYFKRFKLDVEIWQLFTVITAIFSIASTFMWFGLLAPTSEKIELLAIDSTKAAIFNTYQEHLVSLSSLKGLNANINLETCEFKYTNQSDIPQLISSIEASKSTPLAESNISPTISPEKSLKLSQIETDFSKLNTTIVALLSNIQKANTININIVQNVITSCKENEYMLNSEIFAYIDDMVKFDFGDTYNQKLTNIKASLFALTPGSFEYYDALTTLLHTTPSYTYIYDQIKPIEQNLVENVRNLETWQRAEILKHPYLTLNTYYIYDEA